MRETQVLALVARGMSNREAAGVLILSEATIKRHLANVYARTGVHSRSKAVAKGLAEGRIILEDIASAGAPATAGGKRYRCVVEGCGCEVIVMRPPGAPVLPRPHDGVVARGVDHPPGPHRRPRWSRRWDRRGWRVGPCP